MIQYLTDQNHISKILTHEHKLEIRSKKSMFYHFKILEKFNIKRTIAWFHNVFTSKKEPYRVLVSSWWIHFRVSSLSFAFRFSSFANSKEKKLAFLTLKDLLLIVLTYHYISSQYITIYIIAIYHDISSQYIMIYHRNISRYIIAIYHDISSQYIMIYHRNISRQSSCDKS